MEELRENQRLLIKGIRKVILVFDAFIIVTLSMVGLFLMVWIVYEFYLVLIGQLPLERGGLSILGSVLILYAVSELLSEEVKHIRGGAISIKAFVGVALAAVIRKVLIISLSPEKMQELITLALVLLSLGLVYWLIHKVERAS
ncbi:MAG: phosphate-starvation-inducible PsiE family protein [Aquificaceae bacterium]|nr:phosphate-starvation-inducible PsiE family protein [Aquificaceae bacterium]MDW8423446.1 phosphate-starvation-inducible PsiE family protein [Aquificaceae bacterium]